MNSLASILTFVSNLRTWFSIVVHCQKSPTRKIMSVPEDHTEGNVETWSVVLTLWKKYWCLHTPPPFAGEDRLLVCPAHCVRSVLEEAPQAGGPWVVRVIRFCLQLLENEQPGMWAATTLLRRSAWISVATEYFSFREGKPVPAKRRRLPSSLRNSKPPSSACCHGCSCQQWKGGTLYSAHEMVSTVHFLSEREREGKDGLMRYRLLGD